MAISTKVTVTLKYELTPLLPKGHSESRVCLFFHSSRWQKAQLIYFAPEKSIRLYSRPLIELEHWIHKRQIQLSAHTKDFWSHRLYSINWGAHGGSSHRKRNSSLLEVYIVVFTSQIFGLLSQEWNVYATLASFEIAEPNRLYIR